MACTILIVEHVETYREALAARLSSVGCATLEASDLAGARAYLKSGAIDVAVVEDDLGGESGVSLVREFGADGSSTKFIVVCSAIDVDDFDAVRAVAGKAKVLRGPLHPNAIVKEVRSLLGLHTSAAPGARSTTPSVEIRPTALVLASDPDLIGHIASALMRRDISVFTVSGVDRMIDEARQRRPHIVLIDADLLETNGFDACRRFRAAEAGRDVSVLLLIPTGSSRHRVSCFDAGADDYVEKPFADVELTARVRPHIELRKLSRR